MHNILSDFLLQNDQGYFCKYGGFYIDALKPVGLNIISHAHGDHASKGHGHIFATKETVALMKARYGNIIALEVSQIPLRKSFMVNGVKVTLYPAGHMLGSAQILMEYQGVRYLYTGDYKLTKDRTCEQFEFTNADVLITETTFADPNVEHPDVKQEILKLNNKGFDILLGCYAMGKAQSINSLINTHCPELEVIVHPHILTFHKVYNEFLTEKDQLQFTTYSQKLLKHSASNRIFLLPPNIFNRSHYSPLQLKAFVSGWKHLHKHNDLAIYLSDHADWKDIILAIKQIQPQQVWTVHGDGRQLKEHLKGNMLVKTLDKEKM